ncbi:hypothetical protein PHMEG_00024725 [Phytophthora megakarya]|uniref:Bzip transcription factor n=1 Tax=Phytophthora megakarya TaxID=4795 RepID=A0A225VDD7_9STRA|nr:hypothetical protein PHMEG_00024725 [Phytophthora megakarya]
MDHSALHPPHHQKLSDTVIGVVLQRSNPVYRPTSGSMQQGQVLTDNARLQPLECASTAVSVPPSAPETQPSTTEVSPELALRRQRRRRSMARYRKKQNDRALLLEKDVRLLQEEVQKLEVQLSSPPPQMSIETTTWNVVVEYFRLFQHGVQVLTPFTDGMDHSLQPGVQRHFLEASATPDVQFGNVCGVDAHLEVWRLCALYHQDFDIRLERLESGAGNALVATTKSKVTITADTLRQAFPHLLQLDQQGMWSPLVSELLGQKLVIPASTAFKWDEKKQYVVSVEYTADMITPLLQLLGNLEDVCNVFDNALVTPEGKLIAAEGTQEYQAAL